jgi:hypothetical protein
LPNKWRKLANSALAIKQHDAVRISTGLLLTGFWGAPAAPWPREQHGLCTIDIAQLYRFNRARMSFPFLVCCISDRGLE